jgi:hypothetical protein
MECKTVGPQFCAPVSLPHLLYGCETWSLTLTEEHRLRVYENGVLRRKFEPKIRNLN